MLDSVVLAVTYDKFKLFDIKSLCKIDSIFYNVKNVLNIEVDTTL
ncbi:MAG: hypothetical protein RR550_04935 [Rikenellaceae bacterium]